MKRRPWILIILAIMHFLSPFGNLIFNALWIQYPIRLYLLAALQPEAMMRGWVEWVAPLIAGAAIYMCKRWSFLLYLICMAALFWASLQGYHERPYNIVLIELVVVFFLNISIVGYFLLPAVSEVYLNPRLRWWESDDRFRAEIETQFSVGQTFFPGMISNISNSGLFIKSESFPLDNSLLRIHFTYAEETYSFPGLVILHGLQNQLGFGVRFQHNKVSLKAIRGLTEKLCAAGRLIEDRKPTSEDSFLAWAKKFFTTGKGVIPDHQRRR